VKSRKAFSGLCDSGLIATAGVPWEAAKVLVPSLDDLLPINAMNAMKIMLEDCRGCWIDQMIMGLIRVVCLCPLLISAFGLAMTVVATIKIWMSL
jgi:hypothetical protein